MGSPAPARQEVCQVLNESTLVCGDDLQVSVVDLGRLRGGVEERAAAISGRRQPTRRVCRRSLRSARRPRRRARRCRRSNHASHVRVAGFEPCCDEVVLGGIEAVESSQRDARCVSDLGHACPSDAVRVEHRVCGAEHRRTCLRVVDLRGGAHAATPVAGGNQLDGVADVDRAGGGDLGVESDSAAEAAARFLEHTGVTRRACRGSIVVIGHLARSESRRLSRRRRYAGRLRPSLAPRALRHLR